MKKKEQKEQKELSLFVNVNHFIIGAVTSLLLCNSYVIACIFFGSKLNVLSYVALFVPILIIVLLVGVFVFLRLGQFVEISEKCIIKRNLCFKVLAKVEWQEIIDVYYTAQSKNGKNNWIVIKENTIPKSYSLLSGFSGIQFWCGANAIKIIEKYCDKKINYKEPSL